MYYHISAQTHLTLTTFEYHKHEMRWYPRGIQKLVSTYELPETPVQISYSQVGVNWGSQNSKCQVLSKFQFGGGGVKLG